ncbi:hypothetical protein F4776DRAFT_654693 [Hypoxylon sp. NC0597]|nr:hypothetical protein F4776DRAFT_654693 [Hypoxylon sp. NC0597]
MSSSQITQPMREVVLHRSNVPLADLHLEDYARVRDMMSAWDWEKNLFSSQQLHRLREQPCHSLLDGRLIIITNDWLNKLQGLWNREIRSPNRQIAYRRPYTFAGLFNLVYKLQQLVYLYYWDDRETVRTLDHHWTIWPNVPRSDVTQARTVIATLATLGFGAWLEDMPTDASQMPTVAMISNFHFNFETRTLSWANINETGLIRPRIKLHLVFPVQDDRPEDEEGFLTAEGLRQLDSSIFSWLSNIPDEETLLPDDAMLEAHSYEKPSCTFNASSETTCVDTDSWSDEDDNENHGLRYNEDDDDNDNNDNDNNAIQNNDDFYHSFGGYDNRRNWDNGGYIPFYGHSYDDLHEYYGRVDDDDNNNNNDRDSSYEGSLTFGLNLRDNGHDDGVFIDNSSDSGYDGSVRNDNGAETEPFTNLDQPSDNNTDSFSDTAETSNNIDKEKETHVADHQTAAESVIEITSENNKTSTTATTTTNNNNNNTLDKPLEGDLSNMFAYIRRRPRQQRTPAHYEHDPQNNSDVPPAYEDGVWSPKDSFDSESKLAVAT